ncbi:MAG TPA: HAMP domain-containing sensor histidine kinase [Flavobacteriales bacterium]|nr:HAMP domain-containing histidine kinase [Flavobacteriales bacterium]MCC6655299.1 HAMP domain-containing histidine kinase [Flavobacteriales bacterium]HMU12475.1 HAMP domain-containing sensor histidine kinase [Flavobacteriales bacterium]HNE79916.1 HAMP domain-containing sensor histidine kinase [Flavobacteriales bacterium]HNM71272.1 HAMP domain-containing sensor histidine kinase [Flavobacteriales bacterium]
MRTKDPGIGRHLNPMILIGVLGLYVMLQLGWWSWSLVQRDREVRTLQEQLLAEGVAPGVPAHPPERVLWMVVGEGGVFAILMLFALWVIMKVLRHEMELARQQRDFLLSASHELRTPIAGLKLHLQTLQRHDLPDEQREALTRHVRTEVDRLHGLTEKILLATKLDDPHMALAPAETDVAALLRAVKVAAEAGYARGHSLRMNAPERFVTRTDADALRSVTVNLLENACKYAPTGSMIDIELENIGPHWELRVSDEGPGIPEADRTTVFRKFKRVGNEETRHAKGTGLGLYITHRLTRALGGHIGYRPRPGGGSIFAASFPLRGNK